LSPILVRPVREQLEHDRVIRLLQAKYKRKFEVAINPGNEHTVPVGTGPSAWYPDLVLQSPERTRKLLGVVEVETAESVNNLEAMSQWAAFGRFRAPFHLYIPVASIDVARRLCQDLQIPVTEIWAYHTIGDQMRFTLVQRTPQPEDAKTRPQAVVPSRPARESAGISRPAVSGASTAAAGRPRPVKAARTARRATAVSPARRRVGAKTKTQASRRPVKTGSRKSPSRSSRAQKRR
jgi:hypothetical protein